MFMVGVVPALLVLYIRRHVPESPAWRATAASSNTLAIAGHTGGSGSTRSR